LFGASNIGEFVKFCVLIHSAPYSSQGSITALKFCRSVLANGHDLYRVFLFRDAVHNASQLGVVAQDEVDIPAQWMEFFGEHSIDASVCVTSALRRGILDSQEASRYEKSAANLMTKVEIAGLGQLVDACQMSDRVVSFG
jgi:tRNA 2-thiouridine synthesizing protein D